MTAMKHGVPGIDFLEDNSVEAMATCPRMKAQCAECPYKEGTTASRHPVTAYLVKECTEARAAFFCHMTIEDQFPTHLCAGWLKTLKS